MTDFEMIQRFMSEAGRGDENVKDVVFAYSGGRQMIEFEMEDGTVIEFERKR